MRIRQILWTGLLIAVALTNVATAERISILEKHQDGAPGAEPVYSISSPAKAGTDSFLVMGPVGSGAPYLGGFEDGAGTPAWNGWTSLDETASPVNWHASAFAPVSGFFSAWCGEQTASWTGYGNNYYENLSWTGPVDDAELPCTVSIDAVIDHNVEINYDACSIGIEAADGEHILWTADGPATAFPVGLTYTYSSDDYIGNGADEIRVFFRVESDYSYSDEDGYNPTSNPSGAMRVDDVVIGLSNGTGVGHDFEDGTLGPFLATNKSVGDFAGLWTDLGSRIECYDNPTPQVAFIDDGLVVPGTGGTLCQYPFCYGPGNHVVNATGGLSPGLILNNSILSPVLAWPDPAHDAALLELDVYTDSNLTGDEAFIIWTWSFRSTADPDPAAIEDAPWVIDPWIWFGGPKTVRRSLAFENYLVTDPTYVQIKLTVTDYSAVYNITADATSPGPYFDNVRVTTYQSGGPSFSYFRNNLAQDGFPQAVPMIETNNLAACSVRFDAARNLNSAYDLVIAPGDSVAVTIVARPGAVMPSLPRLHYRLDTNPLFDPYRSSGLPASGSVECTDQGDDVYSADLPDEGFLFPGDVVHYYFSATDQIGGDIRTTVLPDTTGFGDFGPHSPYSRRFIVRALPSVSGTVVITQPRILFWNDYNAGPTHSLWIESLEALGLVHGTDYDDYFTTSASTGEGNGLGGRATLTLLKGYDTILYTCGGESSQTLGMFLPDYYDDPGNDLGLLESWLKDTWEGFHGGKNLFLTGDHLVSDLYSNDDGRAFMWDRMGVNYEYGDTLRVELGGQRSPRVAADPSAPAPFWTDSGWFLNGECPSNHTFDAVVPAGSTLLAGFTAEGGSEIAYPYAAATTHLSFNDSGSPNRVVFMPFGLYSTSYGTPVAEKLTWGPHVNILSDVLDAFLYTVSSTPPDAAAAFRIAGHPNPFNPATEVSYTVPRPGRLEIAVYDVAGRRVTTLLNERVEGGGQVTWNGTDTAGRPAASGVYFCRARFAERTEVLKLMLVK